jgi:hypothetical protein
MCSLFLLRSAAAVDGDHGQVDAHDAGRGSLERAVGNKQGSEQVEAVAARAAAVFGEVFEEIGVDVFKALRALETALDRRPLVGRMLETGGE